MKLAWCLTCEFPRRKLAHFIDGIGFVGHNSHILEAVPNEDVEDFQLTLGGGPGRILRLKYEIYRALANAQNPAELLKYTTTTTHSHKPLGNRSLDNRTTCECFFDEPTSCSAGCAGFIRRTRVSNIQVAWMIPDQSPRIYPKSTTDGNLEE